MPDQNQWTVERINELTPREMAILFRFEPETYPVFRDPRLAVAFYTKFREIGGISSEMSKDIGWDRP